MLKQKFKNSKTLSNTQSILTVALLSVFAVASLAAPLVRADQFDDQINAIKQESAGISANLSQLGSEAASLSDTINKMQEQINNLQVQIRTNQARNDDLQRQIVEAEAQLAEQRRVLGESIRQMYLEGQISTLEMLASSNDLSEFVDKQQYRDAVQNKLKSTLDKINALKAQLKSQKTEVEALIKDQQNMQSQLAAQQAEQNRLLSLNQAQQNELDAQIQANNSKVSDLKRQQQAAIAAASRRLGVSILPGSGNGGYPDRWANAAPDSLVDTWGMFNRECVSYVAYRVAASGRYMPYWGGFGNANQWVGNAQRAGIPTGYEPRVGSVASMDIGYYGHVMYVEAVYGDGRILVSQYNWSPYAYSQMIIPSGGLTYIYF